MEDHGRGAVIEFQMPAIPSEVVTPGKKASIKASIRIL